MRNQSNDGYMKELEGRGHRQIALSLARRLKKREKEIMRELKARFEEELQKRLGQDEEVVQIRDTAEMMGIDLARVELGNKIGRSVEGDGGEAREERGEEAKGE